MLLFVNKGINSFISFIDLSHHFNFNNSSIISSSNLFLIIFAGFPPTIEYGGTSLVTTEPFPTITPSPIFIPGKIVTSSPIQTSFPIVVFPLIGKSFFDGGSCFQPLNI